MTSLHVLRRRYALSFSELAMLTAVPARRLAAFEYHGHPLSAAEQRSLALLFGVADHALEGGFVSRIATQPTLTPAQAQALALIAATAALAWSLRLGRPQLPQFFAAFSLAPAAVPPPAIPRTPTSTSTPAPTTTEQPTSTPTPAPTSTSTSTPIQTPPPTPAPTSTPTSPPAAQPQQIQIANPGEPHRCPIVPQRGHVIVTQGYGIGTHTPAAQLGALDLAVADGTTQGTTVVATHAGRVQVAFNTWPAGNHIWLSGDAGWRTGYSHLQTVLVNDGDYVEPGTPIGTVGSTGYSTGPHLDYQTWHNGVNVDPSPRLFCK